MHRRFKYFLRIVHSFEDKLTSKSNNLGKKRYCANESTTLQRRYEQLAGVEA